MPLTTNRNLVSGTIAASGRNAVIKSQNLILQSENFVTSWVANAASIVQNNQDNPIDGLITASTFVENSTNTTHYVTPTGPIQVVGDTYTLSCYVKPAGRVFIIFSIQGLTEKCYFGLYAGGFLGQVSSAGFAQTIHRSIVQANPPGVSGSGWFRCSWTYKCLANPGAVMFILSSNGDGVSSYLGSGIDSFYIYGTQVNKNNVVLDYTKTTTVAVNTGNPRNADYDSRDNSGGLAFKGRGLLAYYLASPDNVTLSGGKVSRWNDISGNNLHMNQAVSGRRPSYIPAWSNGQDALSFSGANVLTTVGNIQNKSNPFTIGMVFHRTSTTGCSMFSPSTGGGVSLTANLNGTGKREIRANGVGNLEDGNATLVPELWIATGIITPGNPGTTSYSLFTGVSITPTSLAGAAVGSIVTSGNTALIGALTNTGGNGLIGYIAEVFFVDRVLTSTEMAAYGDYVLNKYGTM
jgi:hypothetical protein